MTPASRTRSPADLALATVGRSRLRETWQEYLPLRAEQLRELITHGGDPDWEHDPELLVALAFTYRTGAGINLYAALSYLDAADARAPDDRVRLLSALLRSACLRGLGRLDEALEVAQATAEAVGATSLPLSERIAIEARARIGEGICRALLGDLTAGEAGIRHGLGLASLDRVTSWLIEAHGWLALIAAHTGTAEGAQPHLHRALELAEQTGLIVDVSALPAQLTEALLAIDRGDYAGARQLLARLGGSCEGTEYEVLRLHALVAAVGGDRGAFEQFGLLQQAGVLLQSWQNPNLFTVQHETVRTIALLQSGALSGAYDAIAAVRRAVQQVPDPRHVICPARLEARAALHVGEYQRVLEVTAPCRALGDDHAPRTRGYVDALRAAAHLSLGDGGTAAAAIDRVLLTSARTGWRRSLSLLPTDLLRMLLANASERPQPAEVPAVIAELQRQLPDTSERLAPLSAREKVILGHLTAGLSRQQISALLHVSPNTVKSQAHSLYRKLGASSRHEAVERAAEYGIRA